MNDLLLRREDAILRIQLNRPAKKNALTAGMYAALAEALRSANADPGVRAVLVHGTPEAFTAGNDLQDFLANPPTGDAAPVMEFLHALSHVEKPFVAAVTGVAIGVGTTMLLHCDLVYAAEDARFALPFVNLGLCPEAASSLLLPAIAGYQRAAELLLLGEPFDAARAREVGIVNEVLAPDLVLTAAEQAAHKLAATPPAAVRVTKRLMKAQTRAMMEAALAEELREFLARLVSPEAKEAFAAFLEKRKPDFARFG
ncbi:MAG: enoyl-CoA hydratase [Burkholderiales bacterium]|nr:enoyl-CoA hydratase [Burkholderiales bacterium]